jgi:hypothetical protein
MVSFRPK